LNRHVSVGWIIALSAVGVFVIGTLAIDDSFAEWIGRILAIVVCAAVCGGMFYGAFVAVTGADPIGLGWEQAAVRRAGLGRRRRPVRSQRTRFQPGC
jgi:hypothetical protein